MAKIENYLKRQSLKTLHGLKDYYEKQIIKLANDGEDFEQEEKVLEAIKTELIKRTFKKVTKELNKRNPFLSEDETNNVTNNPPA